VEPKSLPDKLAQFLPRGGLTALTEGFEFISLWRWARLSLLVGAVVGLAAAGVFYVLEWGETTLLHRFTGAFDSDDRVWWLLLIVPATGGLLAGLVIWRFAPETAGAGTGNVIDAFHNHEGRIRRRVPVVKLVATLFTLGSGGSAGREGPMAHIGAGFGSWLGTTLGLGPRERRLLLLAGAAGGISALLRTPLGAALWALEILYRDDFESEGLFPCLVSSVTSYSVMTTIYDQGSLFTAPASYEFQPAQLVFYAGLGLACAIVGLVWVKHMHAATKFWAGVKLPIWVKPAIGGLLLGGLAIAVPWIFGTGFAWVQDALRPVDDPARLLPIGFKGFGVLLGIGLAKILATSFTVASGGSGGKFAPTLFIGGFVGGAFGLLFHEIAPAVVPQPGAFVFVGMAALYAGVAKLPISTIILVSELFGSYDLLVPIMFTEMITVLLMRRVAMYPEQVASKLDSPAHVADFTVDILQDLAVADHYTVGRASETVPTTMNLHDFLERVSSTADSFFVVRGRDGNLRGIVSLSNVRSVVADQEFLEHVLVTDAMWPFRSVDPKMDLRAALRVFLESGYDHLPVVDPAKPTEILGMLSQQQIFAAYNAEILRRRLTGEAESD
jgi:CIC family chloride channel protein